MGYSRIINRYASAFIQDARENDFLDHFINEASQLINLLQQNRDLQLLLKNPIIPSGKKWIVFKKIFRNRLHDRTLSYIELIIKHGREYLLKAIFEHVVKLYKSEQNILEAELVVSQQPDDEIKEKIAHYLKEKTGAARVELKTRIDSNIIGGFKIKFDNKLLDTSVATKLNQLKKHILSS